jgi:ribosomal-protein-alanine N-acetyltransferase
LASDLEVLCEIENDSFAEPYPRFLLRKLLREHASTFLVALNGAGVPVGYCVAAVNQKAAHLISIAVSSAQRRAGVGRGLVKALVERLAERGVGEIWLEVKTGNKEGISLYDKLGFVRESVIPSYYSDGSDALVMRRYLVSNAEG